MHQLRHLKVWLISAVTLMLAAACSGGGSHDGGEACTGLADTVYKPAHAAYMVLGDSAGLRAVVPDTSGGYSFAAPLYIGPGAPAGAKTIKGPAQRIVCMSSTHVAMLSALGLSDRVVGVSGLRYISDEEVRRRRPADVGPAENIDYELLLSLHPDLVLLYGIGAPSPMQTKLDELGIPYIYLNEFNEQSPLGKAEWLVAVAEICGVRNDGIRLYDAIAGRYEALRQSSAGLAGKPRVMVNTPYNGSWFMPAGNSYMVRLIEDAGGSYVYPNDNSASEPVDMEEAYLLASQADVWLNVDAMPSLDVLRRTLPRFAGIPAVDNGNVWASNKRSTAEGGNDFYESAIIYPDRVLADLHAIFGGHADSTYYYVRLE